jgi:AraC-like DNA-binding protein
MTESGSGFQPPRVWLTYARPAAHLAAYVSGYHCMEVVTGSAGQISDLAYPSWSVLRIMLGGTPWQAGLAGQLAPVPDAAVFGPSSHATHFQTTGGLLVGAGITPLGWVRMFAADASTFANRIAPLDELVGAAAAPFRQRLRQCSTEVEWNAEFDAFFTARLAASPEVSEDVVAVHRMLIDPQATTVEAIARKLDITPRHVGRIALHMFGLPPKVLLRRARFLRALLPLRAPDPRPLPERVRPHYPDYSHFTRDCRAFLGMSPSAFVAMPRPISDVSTSERTRQLGAPAQALHVPAGAPQQ